MPVELDLEKFWQEEKQCNADFTTDKPRCPISLGIDDHWLLEEMQLPSTLRYYQDETYRIQINKECNNRLEKAIGKRKFGENPGMKNHIPRIEEVFGCHFELIEGGTPWLESKVKNINDLEEVLDRVESMDLKAFLISPEWKKEREEREKQTGKKVKAGGGSRGPATIGTSVCGTTNYLMFLMDYPEIMDRFTRLLADKLVEYNNILREETQNYFTGYGFADDNCCLLSPDLYRRFCAPVVDAIFSTFAPEPVHRRHQHSDSAMGHIIPILRDLGLNSCNFGPELTAQEIREQLPKAIIYGQMPPMLLRNGTDEEVIARVKQDFNQAGKKGGLVIACAGSIAAGTSLERLRLFMWATQEFTRYY